MDPPGTTDDGTDYGFPRRRGDGPLCARAESGLSRFSPQARGWTLHRNRNFASGFVFPAGAGMDPHG